MVPTRSIRLYHRRAAALAIGISLICAMTAHAQGGTVPEGFKPPPVGTHLIYGANDCSVVAGEADETVCVQGDHRARLYGGIFAHGRIDWSGFGGIFGHVNCLGFDSFAIKDVYPVGNLKLDAKAKRALKGLWPMKIGKKAHYAAAVSSQDEPFEVDVEITGSETLEVAGERRNVFVVKATLSTMTRCDGQITSGKQTWWYDAKRGIVVKYAHITYEGLKPAELEFTLSAIRLPEKPKGTSNDIPVAQRPDAPSTEFIRTAEADNLPPALSIPANVTVHGPIVEFQGRASDTSRIVEVTVAGSRIPVGPDGSFIVRRGVPQGESRLQIAAIDEWGNMARRTVAVTRKTEARSAARRENSQPGQPAQRFDDIDFGRYHALVVGNNDYRSLPGLESAIADAGSVSDVLQREYGFHVTRLTDATRSDILGTLAKFRARLKAEDNLLIYYAGHGILDKDTQTGYWLPTDAEATNPANWISTSDITTMLRALKARHVMIVADSCYSGTLVRAATVKIKTSVDRGVWLKRMRDKRARTALVSGGLEPVMDGGGGRHSVFAKAFIDALRENNGVLEGQALFDRIKRPVVLNADQTPQYSDIRMAGHEGGDFIFVRR